MPRRIDVRARKAPQQQRSQQMRADILEAAVRVLGREGAERFTTARVAQAAGVSVGSLYQYFPNKHAILYAVHERIVEDAWREVQAILDDGERAPREKLVAIARRFFTGEARDVAEFGAPLQEAERFFAFWGQRLFGDAPTRTAREGFVYVPLQGRLLEHRSFQSCAPLDMLRQILRHETRRRIVATLHPKECHAPADLAALDRLAEREPRLTLTRGAMEPLLQACDYVATQNSSAAFAGYFFRKPAVLFARVDFHHIAANVTALGAEAALRRAPELEPDYAGYLHWFWQEMSINAGRPEAEAKILAALQRHGWPT